MSLTVDTCKNVGALLDLMIECQFCLAQKVTINLQISISGVKISEYTHNYQSIQTQTGTIASV